MSKRTERNNKTERVLSLLTGERENAKTVEQNANQPEPVRRDQEPDRPEKPEDASERIRKELEKEYQKESRESMADPENSEEISPEEREAAPQKQQEDPLPDVLPEEKQEEDYIFFNVMEALVRDQVEENLKRFGGCTCKRCRTDAAALALNQIFPKYIVAGKNSLAPLKNYFEKKYATDVLVALVQACIVVSKNPRH